MNLMFHRFLDQVAQKTDVIERILVVVSVGLMLVGRQKKPLAPSEKQSE